MSTEIKSAEPEIRNQDAEFGRQLLESRNRAELAERQAKQKKIEKRRMDYERFKQELEKFGIVLSNLKVAATKWRDDLKFLDCAELNQIRSRLEQIDRLCAPVAESFSDSLPVYLPFRPDRGIPEGYSFDSETGKWKHNGF